MDFVWKPPVKLYLGVFQPSLVIIAHFHYQNRQDQDIDTYNNGVAVVHFLSFWTWFQGAVAGHPVVFSCYFQKYGMFA